MKKSTIILSLVFALYVPPALAIEQNYLGNGNDNCQIGLPGHKGNQHKITYMTKYEFEKYLKNNNLDFEQMSNNEGSNGWITYHIYNLDGKQIEVVHIKFKSDIVGDGSDEDGFLRPELPLIPLEPSKPINPPETEEEENEQLPDIEVTPELELPPVENGNNEDNVEVIPPNEETENDSNDIGIETLPQTGGVAIEVYGLLSLIAGFLLKK